MVKLCKPALSRVLIAVFGVLGMAIMVYLAVLHYIDGGTFCDISNIVSCSIVTSSIYAEIFGVPVAILGILYFGLVLGLIFFDRKPRAFQRVALLTLFVLVPSLYLTFTEAFFLKAYCFVCESAKVVMVAILIPAIFACRKEMKFSRILYVVIAGLIAAGIMYFGQTL